MALGSVRTCGGPAALMGMLGQAIAPPWLIGSHHLFEGTGQRFALVAALHRVR